MTAVAGEWMLEGVAVVEVSNILWNIHDLHGTADAPRQLMGNVRKIGNLYGANSVRFPSERPYFDDFDSAIRYVVRLASLDVTVLEDAGPDSATARA
ncbi:hypothetical protein [Lacisediminihabitans profunda]|uniref:Uncharacterized protein n=1 Tax=Lacisediminihabitans profunda TaxID=2594790 RepID=A0A5C8UTF0_9MICO|nr:hypothetical protein [Lacisediminihabitans profunda]TXN31893.1 hypothetical protein FVP33_02930 [Lacisediminihabitans profunda]